MFSRDWKLTITAISIGLICLIGLPACNAPGGGGTPRDNDDGGDPAGVTFGGVEPDAADVAAIPQAINPYAANATASLPGSVVLDGLPPVGNQGNMGSCTAWASAYASATYTANRQYGWGVTSADHQASPGYLYAKLLETDKFNCGSGTYIQSAMDLLIQNGCSSLDTVEYRDDMCFDNPSAADAASFRIGSFNRTPPQDRNAMRGELAAGRIIPFGAKLYDDFPQFRGDSVYRGSGTFLTSGSQHAAHAMAVVGYDDTRGAYRIMNSWGTQWGDGGFMWMAYETFEATAYEAYSIEPRGDREPPAPDPDDGDDDGGDDDGQPGPNGYLDEAYQFAEEEGGQTLVYLVFFYHFDEAVLIRTITVTDPSGNSATQDYDLWYSDGYVYFVRDDGFQWDSGDYTLVFDTQTQEGVDVTYTGQSNIKPLDGADGDGTCMNTCFFAFDGECDDGGAGSDYDLCDYGTDCYDCGTRDGDDDNVVVGDLCSDECATALDGECDDGGPGALYNVCDYGTDCSDCGARDEDFQDDDDIVVGDLCSDECESAGDGECDDGGPGADFDVCDLGTDCTDCGPRDADDLIDDDDDVSGLLCTDDCETAFDGECDDGGVGSDYSTCAFGTDCSDCGPRDLEEEAKTTATQRVFRGIPVVVPPNAAKLPAAGVRPGVLGGNRQPAAVTPAE